MNKNYRLLLFAGCMLIHNRLQGVAIAELKPEAVVLASVAQGTSTFKLIETIVKVESPIDKKFDHDAVSLKLTETDSVKSAEVVRWDGLFLNIRVAAGRRGALWIDKDVIGIAYALDTLYVFQAPRSEFSIYPPNRKNPPRILEESVLPPDDFGFLKARLPLLAITESSPKAVMQLFHQGKAGVANLKSSGKSAFTLDLELGGATYDVKVVDVGTAQQNYEVTLRSPEK